MLKRGRDFKSKEENYQEDLRYFEKLKELRPGVNKELKERLKALNPSLHKRKN